MPDPRAVNQDKKNMLFSVSALSNVILFADILRVSSLQIAFFFSHCLPSVVRLQKVLAITLKDSHTLCSQSQSSNHQEHIMVEYVTKMPFVLLDKFSKIKMKRSDHTSLNSSSVIIVEK